LRHVSRPQEDTLVRHARREAAIALAMWLVAMTYTITYCYANGYGRTAENLSFVLWFPDWVFWGIVVPWGICVAASLVFAFRIMGDESLGEEIDADPAVGTEPMTGEHPGEHREVRDG
jgi:hypothetical protein